MTEEDDGGGPAKRRRAFTRRETLEKLEELEGNVVGEIDCPARALRALGLLLSDGDLTVHCSGVGQDFWRFGRLPSRKRA